MDRLHPVFYVENDIEDMENYHVTEVLEDNDGNFVLRKAYINEGRRVLEHCRISRDEYKEYLKLSLENHEISKADYDLYLLWPNAD